jgi:hypothetical protein
VSLAARSVHNLEEEMATTRIHEVELYSKSSPGRSLEISLEATAALSAHDTEVCVDEIEEITLKLRFPHNSAEDLNVDIDPTEGIGVALCEFFEHEFESVYADAWEAIARVGRHHPHGAWNRERRGRDHE